MKKLSCSRTTHGVNNQEQKTLLKLERLSFLFELNHNLLIFQTDGLCLCRLLISSNLLLLFSPFKAQIKTDENSQY